ncbi:MAG TPA: hypothetical protein VHX42_03645, partial [Candidatus Babeliales bacterium]|nr:hypothetical protein [Candidatus Babeliales bacterium]
ISDLSQLVPYCEHKISTNNTTPSDEIYYLVALYHVQHKQYERASHYIDKIKNITNDILLLRAEIYTRAEKSLSHEELEVIFKLYVNRQELLTQKDIWLLTHLFAQSSDFFIQTQKYKLALTLIQKVMNYDEISAIIIGLAYHIERYLIQSKHPYFTHWRKKLVDIGFYTNIKNPSHYSGIQNYTIGHLLTKEIATYETIITHLEAALKSQELSPDTITETQKLCAQHYYNWALTIKDNKADTELCLSLLNKAVTYDNSDEMRLEKAIYTLNMCTDKDLVNNALQTLEIIAQIDNSINNPSATAIKARLMLGTTYCHYYDNCARSTIPFNIDKAMFYFNGQTLGKSLLIYLMKIFRGKCEHINTAIKEKYINPLKELECIDYLLNLETHPLDKEKCLARKVELLLAGTLEDSTYDHILECFKQTKLNNNSLISFDKFPVLHEHTRHLVTSNNMTEKAIEWCWFAANSIMSHIRMNPKPSPNEPTEEQKDLAHYLFKAAKMNNLSAQMILLPYYTMIGYHIFEKDSDEALNCTYTALLNPHVTTEKLELDLLINFLIQYVETGNFLPYFILCDHYKNNPQELEKLMKVFSKAENYTNSLNDTTDTIDKIILSCKSTFMPYVNNYWNKKNPSLIDTLGTLTYGAMLAHSNDKYMLENATAWLTATYDLCTKKFNLSQLKNPIHTLLASTYYKRALPDENNTKKTDLTLLRKAVELGWLEAAHLFAEIYIQQYESEEKNTLVTEKDFLPLLQEDMKHQRCERTIELMSIYSALKEKPATNTNNNTNTNTSPKNENHSQKGTLHLLSELAHKKKMIKFDPYKETSSAYVESMILYNQADSTKNSQLSNQADTLLRQAVKEQPKHACALMKFALRLLQDKQYSHTKTYVQRALTNGLIIADGNTTKQFFSGHFLHILFLYIESIFKNHPDNIQRDILPTVHMILDNNGINIADFVELFEKIMGINLSLAPQWCTKEIVKSTADIMMNKLIAAKDLLDDYKAQKLQKCPQANDPTKGITKDPENPPSHDIKQTYVDLIKSMIKSPPSKLSPDFITAFQLCQQGMFPESAAILAQASKQQDACACVTVASNCLTDITPENLAASAKFLTDALKYGLYNNKFCNEKFLYELCIYIQTVMDILNDSGHRALLLSTIKNRLIEHKINLDDFCTIVLVHTGKNLSECSEWIIGVIKEKKTEQMSFTELLEAVVKIPEVPLSSDFLIYRKANSFAESLELSKKLREAKNPITFIESATGLIMMNSEQNYIPSKKYLGEALKYGLVAQKFCNCTFLYALLQYLKKAGQCLSKSKKTELLSIVLEELKKKDIDCGVFDQLLKLYFEQPTLFNFDSSFAKGFEGQTNTVKKSAEETKNKKQQMSFTQLIKSIMKDPEDPLSSDFLAYDQAVKNNNHTESSKLAKKLIKGHNPILLINTASELLRENAQKNYDTSKELLCDALKHGLVEQKFCNRIFLYALFHYMKNMKEYINDITKTFVLYSIIKEAYKKNNINIGTVDRLFEAYNTNVWLFS